MFTEQKDTEMGFQSGKLTVHLSKNGGIRVKSDGNLWTTRADFQPSVRVYDRDRKGVVSYLWSDCAQIVQERFSTGFSTGIRTIYRGFPFDSEFSFAAYAEVEEPTCHLKLGIIPLHDADSGLCELHWPGPMDFRELRPDHYTVYPLQQGILIPNGTAQDIHPGVRWYYEEEQIYSRSAYMPWFGQIRQREGFWLLVNTPFDAGFHLDKPSGGPCSVNVIWKSQLGRIGYRRECVLQFLSDCDYNTFCKLFRKHLIETGELCSLTEKISKNPAVEKLLGTAVYHTTFASYDIHPASRYYDHEHPEKNRKVTPFSELASRVEKLKAMDLQRVFVHVDGWGKKGYDNEHPDVFPPCEEAGGYTGLRELMERIHQCGYLFALHDQYRDYYHAAETYDAGLSLKRADGSVPGTTIWYGGPQDFLCPEFALGYVKRNYRILAENGILQDGTYQDCFSCSTLDECYDPAHPVTREQCMKLRKACFDYVRSLGIIISSEEGVGWAIRDLDLVHHAPYAHHAEMGPLPDDEWEQPEGEAVSVPLLNLVYHDCIVIPWHLNDSLGEQSTFLHALLNGGVPYVGHDSPDALIHNAKIVAKWHSHIGTEELIRHEILSSDGNVQKSTFASGCSVTVDFRAGTFSFTQADGTPVF